MASRPGSSAKYVAIFNIGDQPSHVTLSWAQLGVQTPRAAVRDLWAKKDLGTRQDVDLQLKPHSSVLYRVTPQ
ncbi:MAG: hypothetical protein ACR2JE_07015 [Acidobacteriaceae bacterium]